MRIAYRRMSGPIGITKFEEGTRGLWLEKRLALVRTLRNRGHRVDFVNRMTKFSNQGSIETLNNNHELLIVEFGSNNEQFYGDDLLKTLRYMQKHEGQIIFICDDPDLPLFWKKLDPSIIARITCWYNCAYPVPFGGQPEYVQPKSFPISGLIECKEPQTQREEKLVYIGRPSGREKIFTEIFKENVPVQIYGREKEWKEFNIKPLDPPEQANRAFFYGMQLGSLVIADKKHKRMGWFTGRAFHAIAAGCPAIAEFDHVGMMGVAKFLNATDLKFIIQELKNPAHRELVWRAQRDWVKEMRIECEQRFGEMGL